MADTKKETGRQARQAADDTTESLTEAAARSTEEATRGAQDVMEEGGHKIERLSERQGEAVKRTARAAEETAERLGSAGASVMTRSGSAVARGWQEVGQTMIEYLQDTTRQNMEATESMMRCRTLGELVQAQSQFMRQSLDTMLQKSARISDISARMLSETAQPMAQLAGREREEREPRNARR